MSREIKFRAWNGKEKRMVEVSAINFLQDEVFSKGNDEYAWGYNHPRYDKEAGIILMQFTGLYDSKSVEIFEGDVAKITFEKEYHEDGKPMAYPLVYTEIGIMEFNYKNAQFSFSCKDSLLEDNMNKLKIEVIGNIYESKHLLNQ